MTAPRTSAAPKARVDQRGESLADYWPLISLVAIAAAAATALASPAGADGRSGMHFFMGLFLCCFAMLKIFDLPGFADGFEMYDVVARRARPYALVYPFIELGLGLSYLAFFAPIATYLATLALMALSSVGVLRALREGLDIHCPCMGSVLQVPLSTVTLTEDLGMGLMALLMLLMSTI